MRMNKYIVKTLCPPDNARLISGHCSRPLWDHIRWATLSAVMLAVAVVLETGCSSTGAGFSPLMIRGPLPAAQQSSGLEENGWNQPPRSLAFSDLVAVE
jgi:hypothetical protein